MATADEFDDDKPQPWHKHEIDRTDQMWAAFQMYRDTPPRLRSFKFIAPKVGQTVSVIHRWAQEAMWKERVRAFDRFVDKDTCRIVVADRREHQVRHLELAMGLCEIAASEAKKLLMTAREIRGENRLNPREIARLAEVAVKLERLTRGEATEITENGDIDLSKLTTEELDLLRELQAKAKK